LDVYKSYGPFSIGTHRAKSQELNQSTIYPYIIPFHQDDETSHSR